MSSEHKRPLYAFAIVAMLCAFFVSSGLRSDAMQGLLRVAEIPVSLDLLERTEKAPDADPASKPASEPGSSPLLTSSAHTPALPLSASRAPRTTPAVVRAAVDTGIQPVARPAVAKDETGQSPARSGEAAKPSKRPLHAKGNTPGHAHGKHTQGEHTHGKHGHARNHAWHKPAHPRGLRGKGHGFGRSGAQKPSLRHGAHRAPASGGGARARGNQASKQAFNEASKRGSQGRSKSTRHASSVRGMASSRSGHPIKVNRGQAKKASVRIRTSQAASGLNHPKSHRKADGISKGNGKNG